VVFLRVAQWLRCVALRISFVAKTKLNPEYFKRFITFWVRAEGVDVTFGADVQGLSDANRFFFT